MTTVFWNGRNGYTAKSGADAVTVPAFAYSSKGRNRCHARVNSQSLVLAQYRPEMTTERETIRRALALFFNADGVALFGDDHAR